MIVGVLPASAAMRMAARRRERQRQRSQTHTADGRLNAPHNAEADAQTAPIYRDREALVKEELRLLQEERARRTQRLLDTLDKLSASCTTAAAGCSSVDADA